VRAVLLVTALSIIAAPETVQAVVATLIRDVDNPGRSTVVVTDCSAPEGILACTTLFTVPAGDRFLCGIASPAIVLSQFALNKVIAHFRNSHREMASLKNIRIDFS
jgi:hypothetical protein